jgi:hypothetical protein
MTGKIAPRPTSVMPGACGGIQYAGGLLAAFDCSVF